MAPKFLFLSPLLFQFSQRKKKTIEEEGEGGGGVEEGEEEKEERERRNKSFESSLVFCKLLEYSHYI